jgi:hypothetical protein
VPIHNCSSRSAAPDARPNGHREVTGRADGQATQRHSKHFTLTGVGGLDHADVKLTLKLTLPTSAMKELGHEATASVAMNLTATNANGAGHRAITVALHLAMA